MRNLRGRLSRLEALTGGPEPPGLLTVADVDEGWRLVEAFHREVRGKAPPEEARQRFLEMRLRVADEEM